MGTITPILALSDLYIVRFNGGLMTNITFQGPIIVDGMSVTNVTCDLAHMSGFSLGHLGINSSIFDLSGMKLYVTYFSAFSPDSNSTIETAGEHGVGLGPVASASFMNATMNVVRMTGTSVNLTRVTVAGEGADGNEPYLPSILGAQLITLSSVREITGPLPYGVMGDPVSNISTGVFGVYQFSFVHPTAYSLDRVSRGYNSTNRWLLAAPRAVGSNVTTIRVGDRVSYAPVIGAYAEYAVVAADRLIPVPDSVDLRTAAAVTLQGMTAHYLTTSTCPLKQGDTALIHAAAGGVGLLLVQVAKMKGARVFGTVSTPEKAKLAREAGADEVILYGEQDFEAEVMRLTGGKGVNAVYDAVGKTTFDKSVNCVGVRGVLALFGQSSGPVPPFELSRLAKNAIFLTRPGLGHYVAAREELLQRASDVFKWVQSGHLHVRISRTLALRDAVEAHRLLEGRQTTGKVLLMP